jgi:hypothetical protein
MDDGRSIRVVETTPAALRNTGGELSSALAWPVSLARLPRTLRVTVPWPLSYRREGQAHAMTQAVPMCCGLWIWKNCRS